MSGLKKDWDIVELGMQASQFLERHFKKILAAFAVIIIASSLWAYKKSVDRQREAAAFSELFEITKEYEKIKAKFSAAQDPANAKNEKGNELNVPADLKPSGDLDKDYGSVVPDLEQFLNSAEGRNATAEAALVLSEIYEEYGQPLKGAEALAKVAQELKHQNILHEVVSMRAGDLWATEKNCDKALTFWAPLAEKSGFISEPAQLKMGVCLQEVGRLDEAKKWFEKLRANSPNSVEGFNAKRYLRFLEFKTKNQETTPGAKNNANQKATEGFKAS